MTLSFTTSHRFDRAQRYMTFDRHGMALSILRIFIGIFFLAAGLNKLQWFGDTSLLARQLANWLRTTPDDSMSHWYLEHVAMPGVAVFARLVPLGEIISGLALLIGFWTPVFASIAFFMVLHYHFAGGLLSKYSSLTNGFVLPVLGATLALAIGGLRLPWSIRR